MRKRNFKNKSSNRDFYNNKPVISAPDLPRMQTTPSSFDGMDYTEGGNAKTAFQRLRDYDIRVDKVELNVVGAAEIYGKKNNKEAFVWHDDQVGIYTGSLNDKYATDDFRLLSTINRTVEIKYWGVDFHDSASSATDLQRNRALATWIKNTSTLLQHIEASRTYDLSISNLQYQPATYENGSSQVQLPTTKWRNVLRPIEYLLIAYQSELIGYIYLVQSFMSLVSMLPELQRIYHSKSDFFTEIQNQLKRSRFTSRVKSLLTWLKKRYVDTSFYKQIIAPLSVVSKKTDGLNSPIMYLIPKITIPVEPLACRITSNGSVKYVGGDYHYIQRFKAGATQRNDQGYVTGMAGVNTNDGLLERTFNAFSVDTILDMILKSDTPELINKAITTWTNTADALLSDAVADSLNFASDEVIIALESMLAKLSTAPGTSSVNWQQNLEVNNLPPVIRFTDWEAVNEIVLFSGTTPRNTINGYELKVPMFAHTGIQKQMQLEYFQAFYLPSTRDYISYINIDPIVTFRTRKNEVIQAQMESTTDYVNYSIKQFNKANNTWELYEIDASLAALIFQDRFTSITFKPKGSKAVTWVNPNLMTYVTIAFTNRGAEFEVWNTQNYIIPLG